MFLKKEIKLLIALKEYLLFLKIIVFNSQVILLILIFSDKAKK